MKCIELGEIYKYQDSRDLYVVSVLYISGCGMYTLVNLKTGDIGPVWDDRQEMVADLEFVANSIKDLLD